MRNRGNRFRYILFQPWLISLVLTGLFAYFFLSGITRYSLKPDIINSTDHKAGHLVFDLDQDGNPEYAYVRPNRNSYKELFAIALHDSSFKVIDDILVYGQYNEFSPLFAFDTDKNGITELFFFSYSGDSLFVNSIEYRDKFNQVRKRKFISIVTESKDNKDVAVNKVAFPDLDKDGNIDFVFALSAGYSLQPRGVYSWTPKTNHLKRSPENGIKPIPDGPLTICNDADGNTFIIVGNMATQNYVHEGNPFRQLPYHDTSSYLYVLNDTLGYLFDPVPISNLISNPIYLKNKGTILLIEESTSGQKEHIANYDLKGSKTEVFPPLTFPEKIGRRAELFLSPLDGLLLISRGDMVYHVDTGQYTLGKPIGEIGQLQDQVSDIVGSASHEMFSITRNSRFMVLDHKYHIIQECEAPLKDSYKNLSISGASDHPVPIVATHHNLIRFELKSMPIFLWRWPIILAALTLFYISFRGVLTTQRKQLEFRQKQEKETLQLQLQAIKNQVDPHFAMNAMNSVLYFIEDEQKENARNFLLKYARLMQMMLIGSDQVVTTLRSELEFVRAYLELEQSKPSDPFDFVIKLEDEGILKTSFPRTLIHTFAENAVKYAMRGHKDRGSLEIRVFKEGKQVHAEISDNGPGRSPNHKTKAISTGRGITIGHRIAHLFEELTGKHIFISLREDIPEWGMVVRISVEV